MMNNNKGLGLQWLLTSMEDKDEQQIRISKMIKKEEEELIKVITTKKTNYKFEYGRRSFDSIKDLEWIPTTIVTKEHEDENGIITVTQTKTKLRKMYKSELEAREWYGDEWKEIATAVRIQFNFTCQECGRQFESDKLNVHHIIPIRIWIRGNKSRRQIDKDDETKSIEREYHEVYGVRTDKPWHTENNLRLLCLDCHADEHPHMERKNLEEDKEIRTINKIKKQPHKLRKADRNELNEMKRRIRNMFQNED